MRATKNFQSTVLGNVQKGDPIPNDKHGQHLRSIGLAEDDPKPETYETKVVKREPTTRTKGKSRGRKRSDKTSG